MVVTGFEVTLVRTDHWLRALLVLMDTGATKDDCPCCRRPTSSAERRHRSGIG
ncbi:hypothetical protein [Streptomyces sp. NPDC058872]|uniref:hypothetical protein n=1 Tax=Streptomyces sp. NPDC058872 TaxID=3346661 RepID=UPI0036760BC3